MWTRIKRWFSASETIFFARLQVFLGIAWPLLAAADLSPLLPPAWMPLWLVFSGILTEWLRRRRAEDL